MEVVCDVMVYFIWFEGCVHRLPCGQATFRAMKGRRRYQRALDRRFLIDQEERRLGAKKRKCVRMIEGAWMVRGWAPPPPLHRNCPHHPRPPGTPSSFQASNDYPAPRAHMHAFPAHTDTHLHSDPRTHRGTRALEVPHVTP